MNIFRAIVVPGLSILLALLATGCGKQDTASTDAGTGNSQQSAGTGNSQQSAVAPTATAAAAVIVAETIVIHTSTLVSSVRISRTVYENTYKADVSNWGTADATITASLASTAAHITVMEGALSFGDVVEGATQESTDTFTVRHDRSLPFDNDALVWTVQATPLPPTTFDLINKALADGVIDAETALVYKVFDEFDDARLPAQYRGRDDGFFEATAITEAGELFNTLSPATQQLLAPFLFIPDVTGIEPGTPQSATIAGAMIAAVPSGTVNNNGQPTVRAAAAPTNQQAIWAVTDEVAIYWDQDDTLGDTYKLEAERIAPEIKNVIWPRLTGLFGKPGPGKIVKIFLGVDPKVKRSFTWSVDCTEASIGLVSTTDLDTLAHELTHALVDLNYPARCNASKRSDTKWLTEATATWAEHFVYPKNNREHRTAPEFLREPESPLETRNDGHEYGAYLWFLYITQGATFDKPDRAQFVPMTWNAIASKDSLGAIEQAIGSLGGFRGEWPQFVLYNWNRKKIITYGATGEGQPYRYYANWDKLNHKAKEETSDQVKVRLNGKASATYPLAHVIPHLAARYFHYDFKGDNAIRSLTFTHPYANGSEPTARVQAIVKIRDQEWKPAEDWTSFSKKSLCRDKPAEDVEELVIVISNSEFTDRSHVLSDAGNFVDPTELKVSALGCNPWVGSVQFSSSLDSADIGTHIIQNETATASNVIFDLVDPDNGTYKATSGIVTWSHTGSASLGSGAMQCSGEAFGTYLVAAGFNQLIVSDFNPLTGDVGDGSTIFYHAQGGGPPLSYEPIQYNCTPSGTWGPPSQGTFLAWIQTNIDEKTITDPDGSLAMRGEYTQSGPGSTVKWTWNLKQVKKAP